MRPRHLLLLVPLLALPVVLALTVGRDHVKRPVAQHGVVTLVAINVKDSIGDSVAGACGVAHHYTDVRAGHSVRFGGAVTSPPHGNWRVKVKLKTCIRGLFQEAGSVDAHVRHDDSFKGVFAPLVPGYYFARASVQLRGRRVARSSKAFFRVR